jgi:hypothetical protein
VSGIRDRLSQYHAQDYPSQLALASRLTDPSAGEGTEAAEVRFVPASSLKVDCGLAYITEEPELETWLDALKAAALAELAKGRRISL